MAWEVLRHLCQHLVGIGWYEGKVNENGDFVGQPSFCNASGFLLQLHSELPHFCVFVTAGHVISDYKERMSNPGTGAKTHRLFDFWGPRAVKSEPIPFDIFEAEYHVEYDKDAGIDLALIQLPISILQMLLHTTTPFTKSNWIHQRNISFESFALVGLPNILSSKVCRNREGIGEVTTFQDPALLLLEECDHPKGNIATEYPQFIGRIDHRASLDNILGMSGGPIFGFRENGKGQTAYWPIAIQSRWFPASRIVIGTLIEPIAATLEERTGRLLSGS